MDSEVLPQNYLRSVVAIGVIWLAYHLLKIAYNLFLHPLKSIPGPRLAAASYLPEFYHDVIRVGRYTKEIRKMHEIYGKNNGPAEFVSCSPPWHH